jgi:hypothetical protein
MNISRNLWDDFEEPSLKTTDLMYDLVIENYWVIREPAFIINCHGVSIIFLRIIAARKSIRTSHHDPRSGKGWEPLIYTTSGSLQIKRSVLMRQASVSEVSTASIIRVIHRPDGGGSTRLWNVSLIQREYTALFPRRLSSSYPIARAYFMLFVLLSDLCCFLLNLLADMDRSEFIQTTFTCLCITGGPGLIVPVRWFRK